MYRIRWKDIINMFFYNQIIKAHYIMNILDIETFCDSNEKIIPYCVIIFFKNKLYIEYGENVIQKIFKILENLKYKKEYIYIHNLNFDGFLIIEFLSTNLNIKFKIFAQHLNIYSISIYFLNKEIHFKCSYKLLPLSLSKISEIFNIQNKTIFPYKFINSNNLYYIGSVPNENFFNSKKEYLDFSQDNEIFNLKEHTITYCQNDIKITLLFLKKLKKIINKFNINITSCYSAPSLALKIYEKKFNKEIFKHYSSNVYEKIIRPSYYGGRCEVYGNPYKNEYIFHYDFTGMYAQCMKEKYAYGEYYIDNNIKDFSKPGIYWIEFQSNDFYIPVLPHHRKYDKKLMFTNGTIIGAYWYEEILLFINKGGKVIRIINAIIFKKYDNIFEEYVNFFTKLRNESSELNLFGKLMINSMYGRLGMSPLTTHTFIHSKKNFNKIEKNVNIISKKELNDILLIEAELTNKLKKILNINNNNIKNNVLLASSITSKARIKLYKAQQSVIENNGRLLYSDTDSVFASYKTNVVNEKHGDIFWDSSKNDTIIQEAIFFSPKSYAIKYKDDKFSIKIKGYNQKNISFDEIKEMYTKKKKIEINNFRFLKKKDLSLSFVEIQKYFDLNIYDKRYFINDYETMPYTYNNYVYEKAY